MTGNNAIRNWFLALVMCAAAVGLCMVYVDRPLAEFVEANVRHTEVWLWLNVALSPLNLVVMSALCFLFGCGVWLMSGRQLRSWTEIPLLCAWSAMWAVAAEIIFKRMFGRGWPDPTFVHDHLLGLHWLHGVTHWDSFPSGTATVSSAIVAVLWNRKPGWRIGGLAIVVVLSASVVLGNYHWLSDVIAGAFLGALIGRSTASMLAR